MFAKVVFLCVAFAAVQASGLVGLVNTGASVSARQQDDFGNYAFNYGIVDGLGATNSRAEVGDGHGNKQGSYTINDIDGRARRVDYVADGLGFRASVKTNEPGTALSAPAGAVIASPYAGPVAPVDVGHHAVAPVPVHAAIAAPVYAGAPTVIASKEIVTANAIPVGYAADHIGIAGPVGHAAGPIGIAGPVGYAAGPIGIAGHAGYAGPIGIAGYAVPHGIAAPIGYAGHLGYGASLSKVVY